MGPFELAAVAIVAGCLLSAYKVYKKGGGAASRAAIDSMEAEIRSLKARISALESIVTERSFQLKEEISRL